MESIELALQMSKSEKFGRQDTHIITARNAFFERHGELTAKFAVDNWPLLAGEVPISTFLCRYEVLKSTVNVPGHLLEFGVFNGANLSFIVKVMKVLAPNDFKRVFGFDSWKGLTEFHVRDGDAKEQVGQYRGRRDVLEEMLDLFQLDESVQLVDGLIEETLPKYLADNPHHIFSYIYVDTDLYASTKLILQSCWNRLSPGGVIVFDEGYHDLYPGEGVAMNEFLATVPGAYTLEALPFARQPMAWIRKR